MKVTDQAFNNNVLSHFNSLIYANVLTDDHIQGNEIAVRVAGTEECTPGYVLKKDLKSYFVRTEDIDKMPIKIKTTYRIIHGGSNVFHVVTTPISVKIVPKKSMRFRTMIDSFCNFKHTNQNHFLLWKLILIAAYISRVNMRLATPASFGKDSVIDALRDLNDNCCRIDNATFAKLEYVLKFPLIICNEVASLKPAEKKDFESFGLSAGAFQNTYVKRSRKIKGTKEIYNISKLSLGFTYNIAKYYHKMEAKGFDETFPEQFLNRFIPFKMTGYLDVSQFKKEGEMDFEDECKKNLPFYKEFIQNMVWYIDHPPKEKYHIEYDFNKKQGRWARSFYTVCLFISLYAKDKSEYAQLTADLYKCHKEYLNTELKVELDIDEEVVE